MRDFEANINRADFASKEKRLLNYIIDLIIFYGLILIFSVFVGIVIGITGGDVSSLEDVENMNPILDFLITMLLHVIYYICLETLFGGRTIGKFITRTKVVLKDGTKPNIDVTLIRSLCRAIPFNAFSFLGDGPGWHDSLSDTRVIDIEAYERRVFELENRKPRVGQL